ncbi:glycosyltransferase [Nostoc sp.]|uniref:glycosyltransferase n=1 Tax=Nostoc sp. TaxID=1180 RepID=UPI002FF93BA6
MKLPLVSIFIPTYNRKNLLIPCIESALAQTFTDFELVIVDNASTDGAWEICQAYAAKDSRIRIFRNETNIGPGFNGLRCLMECKGYYAKVLFSDDLISPDFLEKTLPLIENNPYVGFVFTGAEIGPEPGQGQINYIVGNQPHTMSSKDFIYYSLFRQGQIVPNSPGAGLFRLVDFRQNVLMKIPSPTMHDYHEHGMGVDILLYLITAHKYPLVAHVPEPLAFFRGHDDSETIRSIAIRPEKWIFGYQQAKIWFTHNYDYSKELQALLVNEWVGKFFQTREWKPFSEIAQQYLYETPEIPVAENSNEQFISDLKLARQYLAEFWLNAPSHLLEILCNKFGSLIHFHKHLISTGIKNEFLTEDEEYFVEQLISKLYQKDYQHKTINYLLALMLYCYPYELEEVQNFTLLLSKDDFITEYVDFLFSCPIYFDKLEDLSNYSSYLVNIVDILHNSVFQLPEEQANNIALAFINSNYVNFSKLQLTEQNLKNIYIQKYNIIEFGLRKSLLLKDVEINYNFYFKNAPQEKIRLGILAEKFNGSEANCIAIPTFAYLDKSQFEIIVYTLRKTDSQIENFVRNICDKYIQLPDSLPIQIQIIREQDLDILLISENITANITNLTLLSFYRLARIQITLPSSPVTTGITNIDYYLSNQLEIHQNCTEEYSEEFANIQGVGCYWLPASENSVSLTRKSLGIAPNTTVFVNISPFDHLVPELWENWGTILAQVPNSVLVLSPFTESDNLSTNTFEYSGNLLKKKIIFAWSKYGIKPTKLIIVFKQGYDHVQQLLSLGDIYLDALNISSSLSIIRALKVGLITISITGKTIRSQGGESILKEIEMTELIANTKSDYIQLAIELGLNNNLRLEKRIKILEKISKNHSFLDGKDYGQKMQNLLQSIWKNHVEQEFINQLRLREINLIVFPNWLQSEDDLYLELGEVIRAIASHPNHNQITLLIDINGIAQEDANLFLQGIAMNLMMEEEIDITEKLTISLLSDLTDSQWQSLIPCINGRFVLEHENQQIVADGQVQQIPLYSLENL